MQASAISVHSSDDPGSYDVAQADACLGRIERAFTVLGSTTRDSRHPFSLDGNVARRRHSIAAVRAVLWDGVLPGFGLRVRRGHKHGSWVVRVRFRTTDKLVTLGRSIDIDADTAREMARRRLAAVTLDGLPRRMAGRAVPTFGAYVDEFLRDYARHWKPATDRTSRAVIHRDLIPAFGELKLDAIIKADIVRWRDSFGGNREGSFNRAIPVLSVMLKYAEALGYRRRGSNPCRGTPRFKRALPERYLSPAEYRRLSGVLAEDAERYPFDVAMIRLLIYTGARLGEISGLHWNWVQPGRLMLPDSKTGPKIVYLNPQAETVLASVPRRANSGLVFPARATNHPRKLDNYWLAARRRAALPDVRLHDLRHSFASTAIMHGIPLATIGKLLGHALPETTARYAHLADEVIADAAERVSGGLARQLGLGR